MATLVIVLLQSTGKFSHDSVLAFTAEISLASAYRRHTNFKITLLLLALGVTLKK